MTSWTHPELVNLNIEVTTGFVNLSNIMIAIDQSFIRPETTQAGGR